MMKRFIKNTLSTFLLLLLIVALVPAVKTEAAKAIKVKISYKSTGDKQYALIKGISSSGKTVWTYKTSKQDMSAGTSSDFITKGNNVYVIDFDRFVRLRKSDGNVLAKKKFTKDGLMPIHMAVDDIGNTYAINHFGNILYSIAKNGKLNWKSKVKGMGNAFCLVMDLKVSGDVVNVEYNYGDYYEELNVINSFDVKTGKETDLVNAPKKFNVEKDSSESVKVDWSEAAGADGYRVLLAWNGDEYENLVECDVVKQGESYVISYTDNIKNKETLETKEYKGETVTSSDLCVTYSIGTDYYLEKVILRSYKIVDGEKVWSNAKTWSNKQ